MNILEYQKLTRNTRQEVPHIHLVAEEEIGFTTGQQVLHQCMDAVYMGSTMDATKRMLFYKDKNIQPRIDATTSKLAEMYKTINAKEHSIPQDKINLLHAALGLASEAGEIMEEVINSILENREINKLNMREEGGDIMWYTALMLDETGQTFESVGGYNIAKLAVRYPDKFKLEDAVNRNLDEEKRALGG
jgi:NTP pyrophosphatase (non-canonical NTP hydrolase)